MIPHGHTVASLCAFTERVKQAFLNREIRAPVHLCSDTQAQPLLDLFESVNPEDHVFGSWRSSFHALLKGVPEREVFCQVLEGRSMYLCSKAHRVLCSSIVGGILPVACGVALGIARRKGKERVHVFVGDATARTGLFHEFLQYCDGHALPVRVVIEDNSWCTNSPTVEGWGSTVECLADNVEVVSYKYERTHPHVGCGQRVEF